VTDATQIEQVSPDLAGFPKPARSALTLLGIAIGVTAIVALTNPTNRL
jgi:hypothetical protein